MNISESFIPESWLKLADITEITEDNLIIFGTQNLNWLILEEKKKQIESKGDAKWGEHATSIITLSKSFAKAPVLPIFPSIRESWHFKNGDKVLVLKDSELHEANIINESLSSSNVTILPRNGNFSIVDKMIRKTSPLLVKLEDLKILEKNPKYFHLWARIGGMYNGSIDSYLAAIMKRILLETIE